MLLAWRDAPVTRSLLLYAADAVYIFHARLRYA